MPIFALASLVGCSDTKDYDTAPDTDTGAADEATECTFTGFESGYVGAFYDDESWNLTAISADDNFTYLTVYQQEDDAPELGVYSLDELPVDDCELCVFIVECGNAACADPTSYFASEGTLEIVRYDAEEGGTVELTLTDVVLSEVSFGDDDDREFKEDGRTWCVDTEYSAELQDADGFDDDEDTSVGGD